jgi:hypothetical protein
MRNARVIPKEEIEALAGMSIADAKSKLSVSESKLRKLVVKYELRHLFYSGGGPHVPKSFYLANQHLTIYQLAAERGIHHATVRSHLEYYDLARPSVAKANKKKKSQAVVDNEEGVLHRKVEFTCMTPGCTKRFDKDISTDLSDERASKLRFMCHNCKQSSGTETIHSYSGQ